MSLAVQMATDFHQSRDQCVRKVDTAVQVNSVTDMTSSPFDTDVRSLRSLS